MSDFIYSPTIIEKEILTNSISSIYSNGERPRVDYFKGPWGSLSVSKNLYNGFDPYEDERYIVVVLGGPILMFQDNKFIKSRNSNEGTQSILNRWKSNNMVWHEDLNGPFVVFIINKHSSEVHCITDIMSFIPVYQHRTESGQHILCSHIDMINKVLDESLNIDEISIIDFILHGVVTYPYTFYENVRQIQPATIHYINKHGSDLNSFSYWEPNEKTKYDSISEVAKDIRQSLENYTQKILKETSNIAQFISGGEDSRTISALLKDDRDAYIYLDHFNREGKTAKRIASIYGAKLKVSTRDQFHYLHILETCAKLVGSGSEYHHAHTYGFHHQLQKYNAVFGGLLADALLKGSHIKLARGSRRFPFIPDIKQSHFSHKTSIDSTLFVPNYLKQLNKRRKDHLDYVSQFRKESLEEWFELWPSSMNRNIPNIHANRRLFRSYEPFLSNEIVKISASVKQNWKLNRKMFNKAVKPYLKDSKWIMHSDGWFPYFPWYLNSIIHFITWTYRQFGRRLGFIKGNQGPWAEWKTIIKSQKWNKKIEIYLKNISSITPDLKLEIEKITYEKQLTTLQYIALTQVLYHLQKKEIQ